MHTQSLGRPARRRLLAAVAAIASATLFTACTTGGTGDDGEGVPAGSSMETYIDALADIDPITVTMSTSAAPGTPGAAAEEAYKAVVEEWSGGTITVEIGYGSSIATLPQHEAALRDGRLQIATMFAAYQPDTYRVFNAISSVANQAQATPFAGYLQSFGAMVDIGWQSEELQQEYADNGLVPLLPYIPTSPLDGLFCSEPVVTLDDASGTLARTSNRPAVGQLEGIGMTPVDVSIVEVFEAYQRGVIDCSVGNLKTQGPNGAGVGSLGGTFSYSPEIGFVPNSISLVADATFWEGIPLAARQLLWDRIDVYTEAHISAFGIGQDIEAVELMAEADVDYVEWDPAIAETLKELRAEAEAKVTNGETAITDPDFVSKLQETHAKWAQIVADLGYVDGGDIADLPEWAALDTIDLSPYAAEVIAIAPSERRPG